MPGVSTIPWGLALGAGHFDDAYINACRDAGARVIRCGVAWDSIDPNLDGTCAGGTFTYVDHLVSYCNSLILSDGHTVGMKLILQLQTGPTFSGQMLQGGVVSGTTITTQPPAMFNYGKAAKIFGARYDGTAGKQIYLLELGNEPNGLAFNSGTKTGIPGAWYGILYAQMLIQVYGGDGINTGLHDTTPACRVTNGGLGGGTGEADGTDSVSFCTQAYGSITFGGHTYSSGWKNHFDVLNHHSYCYPASPKDDTSRGWFRMLQCRAAMVAAGDSARKVTVTEWGDPSSLDTDPSGVIQNDAQHVINAQHMQDAYDLFTGYSWADSFCFFEYMNNNKASKTNGNQIGNANCQGIVYNVIPDPANPPSPVPPTSAAVKKTHVFAKFQALASGTGTAPPSSLRPADIAYGVGFTPSYSDSTKRTNQFNKAADLTTGLGLKCVRIDVQWDDIQGTNPGTLGPGLNDTFNWTNVDKVIAECDARGLKWLVMFGYGANWTNGNAGDDKQGPTRDAGNLYPDAARAIHAVVDHIQTHTTQVDANGNPDLVYAVEMWNEPNTAGFFHKAGGAADPQGYWTMARGMFNAVKTGQVGNYSSFIRTNLSPAYPNVRVVTGGATTPQGGTDRAPRDWVKDCFTYGAGSSFDNFGLHIYDWEFGPLSTAFGGADPLTGWNPFIEAKQVRDYLVSKGVTSQIWCTESGASVRPDSTGTDTNSHSGVGGFDGTLGHTPGAGQSVTDAKEINYTLATSRYLDHDTDWQAYEDSNGLLGWTGPTFWYGIESTIAMYHVSDGSGFNFNYGFFEFDAESAGAEKKPATWPTIHSPREIVNALANVGDLVNPTVELLLPSIGDPALKGNVIFYAEAHDDVTTDSNLLVKLHRDNKDTHVTDIVIGTMSFVDTPFYNYSLFFDTSSLTDGIYQFWITAEDQAGNIGPTSITYLTIQVTNVGDAPPSVTITTINGAVPTNGQGLKNQTVTLVVTATDDIAIANVHLFVDGLDVGASSGGTPPAYDFSYDTHGMTAGTHVFEAVATDSGGNVTTSIQCVFGIGGTTSTDTDAPTVTVSAISGAAPINDQILSGIVPISVTAVDVNTHGSPDPNPTTHLLIDGSYWTATQPTRVGNVWTWLVDSSGFDPADEHNIIGRSTDSTGNVGKSAKAFFFTSNPPNQPPVVTIQSVELLDLNYSTAVLSDSPRGYWRLGETVGPMADTSGNGHDAAVQGTGSTRGVTGLQVSDTNKAFRVAGAAYAEAADNDVWSIDHTGALTIEFIMKPSSFPGTGDPVTHSNGSIEWAIRTTAAGLIQLRAWTPGTTPILGLMSATTFIAGTTYHIACVYNNAGVCKIYVNGVLDASGTMTGSTANSNSPLRIGARGDGAEFFNGVIDEVAIYPRELTAARIAAHYTASVSTAAVDDTPDGMTVGGSILVTATATDDEDTSLLAQVVIDGVPQALCFSDGIVNEYAGTVDTTEFPNGPHELQVLAVDTGQEQGISDPITININNAPLFKINTPTSGQQVSGVVTLNIDGPEGSSIDVWEGNPPSLDLGTATPAQSGGFQFVLDTNKLVNGAHTLTLIGSD